MGKNRRRVLLTSDSGATVAVHIDDDTKPETIDAFKSLADAVAKLTPEQIEAMRRPNRAMVDELDKYGR